MQEHPESHPRIQQHITHARSHPGHTHGGGGALSPQSRAKRAARASAGPPPADPSLPCSGGRGARLARRGRGRPASAALATPAIGGGEDFGAAPPPPPNLSVSAPWRSVSRRERGGRGEGAGGVHKTLEGRGVLRDRKGIAPASLSGPEPPFPAAPLDFPGRRGAPPARARPCPFSPAPRSGPASPAPTPLRDSLRSFLRRAARGHAVGSLARPLPPSPPPVRTPPPAPLTRAHPPSGPLRSRATVVARSARAAAGACGPGARAGGGTAPVGAERGAGSAVTAPPRQCPRGHRRPPE